MTDSQKLLAEYVTSGSEEAFRELVARYLDLVYSTAIRLVCGDRHLAQDVAQIVFVDLAREAHRLSNKVMLGGWLHRHTCFVASKTMRGERRRQLRERQAVAMKELQDHSEANLAQVAAILDEAINQLGASDRTAILLRFFEQRNLRSVGEALGSTENAAQQRVARALEKLRDLLKHRGVALSGAALGTALASEAVTAAPAGLAVSISSAALATAAAGTGTTLTLLKFMASTKLNTAIISAILILSVLSPLVVQQQAQARLREQGEALQLQMDRLTKLRAQNQRLSNLLARAKSSRPPSGEQLSEALRLRGQIGRLHQEVRDLAQSNGAAPMSRSQMLASMAKAYSERVSQLKQLLEANPSEKIPELQFLTEDNWLWLANKRPLETEEGVRWAMSTMRQMAEENVVSDFLRPALLRYAQDRNGQFPRDISQLKPYFKSPVDEPVLDRWVILPKSNLVPRLETQLDEDLYITQRAPVNAALDQRILCGLKTVHSFADGPPEFWNLVR